jgi:hypothetical protein
MTKFTISKKIQPTEGSFLKNGMTFYRVKRDGVYLTDFPTKQEANEYIKILKNKYK